MNQSVHIEQGHLLTPFASHNSDRVPIGTQMFLHSTFGLKYIGLTSPGRVFPLSNYSVRLQLDKFTHTIYCLCNVCPWHISSLTAHSKSLNRRKCVLYVCVWSPVAAASCCGQCHEVNGSTEREKINDAFNIAVERFTTCDTSINVLNNNCAEITLQWNYINIMVIKLLAERNKGSCLVQARRKLQGNLLFTFFAKKNLI